MNATCTRRVTVESSGGGVAAHVGLHALGRFADALGLVEGLSAAIPPVGTGPRVHDRGKVLAQMALVMAGGGESCADIEHLRLGPELFGSVPSDTTVFRTFHEITPDIRAALGRALAPIRAQVWEQVDDGEGPVVLDIDASLVEVHSEHKEQAAPTYKGGFGFHPMFCFADLTGDSLSSVLRPGNAGANTAVDHISLLDEAIAQLPEDVARGHRVGDDPSLVTRTILVRADSAGCTNEFLSACRARNVLFMVTVRSNNALTRAITDAIGIEGVWLEGVDQAGRPAEGTSVCELTTLVGDGSFPTGTRTVVRREPLHQGAQRSLFSSLDYRYWGFVTDMGTDPVALDAMMRAHAHVENHIERLKDSGLLRFPFTSFEANAAWMAVVTLAADLVRWFQLLCLEGSWKKAAPKTLRWGLFHAPGRLVHSARKTIVRIIEGWPATEVLVNAYRRIAALT